MKISIKTLRETFFEIDVNPTDVVADVKKTIEANQGSDLYPAARQMLVQKGRVLKDDTTLEENNVVENSFILMALTVNRTVFAPPPPPPQPLRRPANADEGTVLQLIDLGGGRWDRETVVQALLAAYNNPERAVEYLYTGLPERAAAPAAAQTVDNILNNPQFKRLHEYVQANPQMLQNVIDTTRENYPDLYDLVGEDELRRRFTEPAGAAPVADTSAAAPPMEQAVPVPDQAVPKPEPVAAIELTAEEGEAVDRLEAMGFDRDAVMEVFIACGKSEELAANYLLDNM